ncbi:hypothetical protein ON010_g15110 [Phytophthora cinnamomi]|nr:hypothetical protein ON010_g15110 [Phytophthora cinnamomi]
MVLTLVVQVAIITRDAMKQCKLASLRYFMRAAEVFTVTGTSVAVLSVADLCLTSAKATAIPGWHVAVEAVNLAQQNAALAFIVTFRYFYIALSRGSLLAAIKKHPLSTSLYALLVTHEYPFIIARNAVESNFEPHTPNPVIAEPHAGGGGASALVVAALAGDGSASVAAAATAGDRASSGGRGGGGGRGRQGQAAARAPESHAAGSAELELPPAAARGALPAVWRADKLLEKTNVKVDWSKFVDEDEDEEQEGFDMSALNGGGGFDINQMMAAQNAAGMMDDDASDSDDEDMPDLDPNDQRDGEERGAREVADDSRGQAKQAFGLGVFPKADVGEEDLAHRGLPHGRLALVTDRQNYHRA